MSTNAGILLETMRKRQYSQEQGISNPSENIKIFTRTLVEKLSKIDPSEEIQINIEPDNTANYIRVLNNEILATMNELKYT